MGVACFISTCPKLPVWVGCSGVRVYSVKNPAALARCFPTRIFIFGTRDFGSLRKPGQETVMRQRAIAPNCAGHVFWSCDDQVSPIPARLASCPSSQSTQLNRFAYESSFTLGSALKLVSENIALAPGSRNFFFGSLRSRPQSFVAVRLIGSHPQRKVQVPDFAGF